MNKQLQYERSHERFTWRGALHYHANPKKRKHFKILPDARNRQMDDIKNVNG